MDKKYAMIQLNFETHQLLKSYCKQNGYNMKGFIEKLIKKEINNPSTIPKNVLKAIPKI